MIGPKVNGLCSIGEFPVQFSISKLGLKHGPLLIVFKGFIIGGIKRIFHLTTLKQDQSKSLQHFYSRLRARGYSCNYLLPIFEKGIKKATTIAKSKSIVDTSTTLFCICLSIRMISHLQLFSGSFAILC